MTSQEILDLLTAARERVSNRYTAMSVNDSELHDLQNRIRNRIGTSLPGEPEWSPAPAFVDLVKAKILEGKQI
jgi:hypothetical protein